MGKNWENRKLPEKTESIFDYPESKMMAICIFLKHVPILNFLSVTLCKTAADARLKLPMKPPAQRLIDLFVCSELMVKGFLAEETAGPR